MESNKRTDDFKIKALKIGLASPERIREWSHGEVTKAETLNYKTLKPEEDGLFDQAIFGPIKDYECACGKFKKQKFKGKTCDVCHVDSTESIVRRERMGHIELAAPVAHIWMTKELPNPSKISLLLDIPYKEIEHVVYFVNYIVLDEGDYRYNGEVIFKKKEVVNLSDKKLSIKTRTKLRRILQDIAEQVKNTDGIESLDYKRAKVYDIRLREQDLPFSIQEVLKLITKYTGIKFGIGAEAIQTLLKEINLDKELHSIRTQLKEFGNVTDPRAKKLLRRLASVKDFKDSGNKPEWMVMNVIPVTPPDTRPIIQLDGGRFTTSDINSFYHKIIIRNNRLRKMQQEGAPDILINNERRQLQEAVDALFDNSSKKKPLLGRDKRPLKSLSNHLKGKQGLFRQNLLGKRVDYSGRSVIVIGPELKMYQVGIPAEMILKLFKPFIVRELIRKTDDNGFDLEPIASNIRIAEKMILEQDDKIWPIVTKVIKTRPVILNRAPTLHRLGIQAFEPVMVEGKAIKLHPLSCTAFNADFDGDQMAVHIPLSDEAVAEARAIMLGSWNILGPKDGKSIVTPTQDMVLGNYYLSKEVKGGLGEGTIFYSFDEAIRALDAHAVDIHALIGISTNNYVQKGLPENRILITTIGKMIFNSILPESFPYINSSKKFDGVDEFDIVQHGQDPKITIANWQIRTPFTKKTLGGITEKIYNDYSIEVVPEVLDKMKALGFKYSMISATSISIFDVPVYEQKYEYIKQADETVAQLRNYYNRGLMTDDERYQQVIRVWSEVKDKVTKDIANLVESPEYKNNSIVVMADSGARGNISNFTQLSGMRGLMSRSYNYDQKHKSAVIRDTIEVPIIHSFVEGLTVSEYFNSSYGARKGTTDTAMKTSKSGYMTRKLVDATQEVIINEEDCHTNQGLLVKTIVNPDDGKIIENLGDRLLGRYCLYDVYNPNTNELICPQSTLMDKDIVKKIEQAGIEELYIRSPLHCWGEHGICQKCFGLDLSTKKEVRMGTSVGIIAAQSIGEPGTQLNMRTFHTGGVAGGSNIAQGFERIKQLFDCISPKPWEKAIISQIAGIVTDIESEQDNFIVTVSGSQDTLQYRIPSELKLEVNKGDSVKIGDRLSGGSIDMAELIKVSGIEAVRQYLINEVQKVYRSQGIEINDKYIEVIVRQLTNKLKIVSPGDSDYFIGETVDVNTFRRKVQEYLLSGKNAPVAVSQIYGVDEAPAKSGSFLSAASFQDTKKTLSDAAAKAQVDYLFGLKENVILGNLIPSGTGLRSNEEVKADGEKMYKLEY